MQQPKIIIINLLRLVLGAVLVFSGYVKAVDPMGTLYKLQDYLTALNLSGMVPQWLLLVAAVALAALSFAWASSFSSLLGGAWCRASHWLLW